MTRRNLIPVLALLFVLISFRWAHSAPGNLDPSFGANGTVTTWVGAGDSHANAITIQPNGKIIAAGFGFKAAGGPASTNDDFVLVRYLGDGTLDATWGEDGVVATAIGTFKDIANAVVVQADGKVVAAGGIYTGSVSGAFGLARYDAGGGLDPTFGTAGTVVTPIGGLSVVNAVAIQPDGRIVAAGYATLGGECQFAVARYDAGGTLDPTFSGDGIVTVAYGNNTCTEVGMALQDDGKIVVTGAAGQTRYVLYRFNTDGSVDTGFGNAGEVRINVGSGGARTVVVQPDDAIIAAGYSRASGTFEDFGLLRLQSSGSPDPSFGSGGIVTTSFGSGSDQAYGAALQIDGKILVVGTIQYRFGIARYGSNGALDLTFGGTGSVSGVFTGSNQRAQAVAVQADGRIVAAGWRSFTNGSELALARYFGDVTPVATSTTTPTPVATTTPLPTVTATPTALPSATSTVTVTATPVATTTPTPTITATPTALPSATSTVTVTATPVATTTPTPTVTTTPTALPSATSTVTVAATPVETTTPTFTATPTALPSAISTPTITTTPVETAPAPTVTPTPAPAPACAALPNLGCRQSSVRASTVILRNRAPDAGDRLTWKWTKGAATIRADFGDPTTTTDYRLCVYDATSGVTELIFAVEIPAGDTCTGGACWTATTRGFRYLDRSATADGIKSLTLKEGREGRAQITLKGVGALLPMPTLPLAQQTTVKVQLENDSGYCWRADYTAPAGKNDSSVFRDRSD